MPVSIIIVILLLGAIVAFWLIRSRGNTTGGHIDTTVTALGAVTEAVEETVDAIAHKLDEVRAAAVSEPAPAAAASALEAAQLAIGVPAAQGAADDLRKLKGVGPKLAALLTDLGITRFDQIAAWGAAEIEKVDAHLGTFKGRITRDNWVEQAGFLAKGDVAGFEARFGKLDG